MKATFPLRAALAALFLVPIELPGGENLVANASFSGDGVGGVLDWELWNKRKPGCRVERLPKAGPEGADAVRVRFSEQNFLCQKGFHLKPGARYRASAWVRTKGLGVAGAFRMAGWNKGWLGYWGVTDLPTETAGEWRKVEWCGEMMPSVDGTYTFAFYGATKAADAYVDIARPELTAEDAETAAQSCGPVPSKPYRARLVPIDKVLTEVPRDDFSLTFYYPGDLDLPPTDYELVGALDGKALGATPLGVDRRAKLDFGKGVRGSDHTIGVTLRAKKGGAAVSSAEYPVRLCDFVKGPAGKKLNNFVIELLRKPLADGDDWFFLPKAGWTFISFGAEMPGATATIDNVGPEAVRHRPGEPNETMRYLPHGWHALHVRGVREKGHVLRIHAVPRIVQAAPGCYSDRSKPYALNYDFNKRYLVGNYNVAAIYHMKRHDCPMRDLFNPWLEERGVRLHATVGLAPWAEERQDADRSYAFLTGWPAWKFGFSLLVDETSLAGVRRGRVCFTEAVWRTVDERAVQAVNLYINDAVDELWTDRETQTSEIAAVINSGRGTGMFYPEVYPAALKDEKAAYAWEEHFLDYARTMRDFVPASADRIVWYFGTFLTLGDWTDWSCPEADMRVQLDHFIRRIATDPGYAPFVGGVAATHFNASDEDIGRFLTRAVRHYCIEGRTDDFAKSCGLVYLPGIVKNADFERDFAHWKTCAAEGGSLKAVHEKGYGQAGQCRKKAPAATGDSAALFTRSAKGENVLAQEIDGLVPGKVYSLVWCTADYDDWKGKEVEAAFSCRAFVSGGEEFPELSYARNSPRTAGGINNHGMRTPICTTHRNVFRAKAATARIGFSDWISKTEAGGPVGRRTMLNYIRLLPYYYADEAELAELRDMFRPVKGEN